MSATGSVGGQHGRLFVLRRAIPPVGLWVGSCVVLALIAGQLTASAAVAAPGGAAGSPGDGVVHVPATALRSHARSLFVAVPPGSVSDASGRVVPRVGRRAPKWPHAGSGAVTVPAAGAARAGTSDVWVGPAAHRGGSAAPRVSRLSVVAAGDAQARRVGGTGLLVTLRRTDGGTAAGAVRVSAPATGIPGGADLAWRLHWVLLPGCVVPSTGSLAVPSRCGPGRVLGSAFDASTGLVSADVPLSAAPAATRTGVPGATVAAAAAPAAVVVLAASPNGPAGSFTATSLSSSGRWSVGLQSGSFSWSTPVPQVPAPAGPDSVATPNLTLSYSSQSVDGLNASTNTQAGWTGLGWDLGVPFIERSYASCAAVSAVRTGDLCWAGEVLNLSLNGTSTPLVKDTAASTAGTDVFRPREDPGWRVERKRLPAGSVNGDDDGEYWTVLTPDGTTYTFGRGSQPTTGRADGSAFTVPVFGRNAGEPCHAATFAASWCQQAWRWNLDLVTDAHGDEASWFYTQERNNYARGGVTTTPYVRGGHPASVEYGLRTGAEATTAPARLLFTAAGRCAQVVGGAASCPALTSTSPISDYPDVPVDQVCLSACTPDQSSPTFFTDVLLKSVAAQRSRGTGTTATWTSVDTLSMAYSFPDPTDGTSPPLFLTTVRRAGTGDGGSTTLPDVTFAGVLKPNRVDFITGSVPQLNKPRVSTIVDELGRQAVVTYGQNFPCDKAALPDPDTNTRDCYPQATVNIPAGSTTGVPGVGWFHRWLTKQVTVKDPSGGAPPQVTAYGYLGTPAYRLDDAPDSIVPPGEHFHSESRGYQRVDVTQLSDPAYRGEPAARALSLTRHAFYRGLDGDPAQPGVVQIRDSDGTLTTDSVYLGGREREVQTFAADAAGSATIAAGELTGVVHSYGLARTVPAVAGAVSARDDAHLVVETGSTQRQSVLPDPVVGATARGVRTAVTTTTYDSFGLPLTVTSTAAGAGAAGGGADRRCTKTSYARDAATVAAGLLSQPFQVRVYAGACSAPASMVASKDVFYDGSTVLGGTITRGDPTRTVTATAASGPDTVTASISTASTYDGYGRTLTATDGNNRTMTTAFSPATGLPTSTAVTNPLGQVTTTTLSADRQQPLTITDVNRQVTAVGYDGLGRLVSVRMPEQAATEPPAMQYTYTLDPARVAAPRVRSQTLQSGTTYLTVDKFLDALGRDRQTQQVSPASTAAAPATIVTDTRYDDRGLVSATSLPVVAPATSGAALVAVNSAADSENRTRYDALARPVGTDFTVAGVLRWTTATGWFGDHTRTTPPVGGVVQTAWTDARGRQIRSDQGVPSAPSAAANTPGVVSTQLRHDDADRLVSSTDPAGHITTYRYDLIGRRIAATDPDAGGSSSTFDGAGNLLTTTDALGVTVTTDYDALDRPVATWKGAAGTGIKLSSASYDATSVPNGIGRLASQTVFAVADAGKPYKAAVTGYDPRGRMTGRSWTFPAGTGGALIPLTFRTTYTWDTAGHRTSIGYPDTGLVNASPETISTGYDTLGRATTLTGVSQQPLGTSSTMYVSGTGYTADAKLESRNYANPLFPIRRSYGYQPDTERVASVRATVTNSLLGTTSTAQDDTYNYDQSGNVTSIVDRAPQALLTASPSATCFGYDALNRISHAWTTAVMPPAATGSAPASVSGPAGACTDEADTLVHAGPAGFNQSWAYSPDGNITTARSLLVSRDFGYADPAHPHAVTSAGLDSYGYDADGQQTRRFRTLVPATITWTPQHQTATVLSGLALTRDVYTEDGTRLARFNPDGTATLYLDGEEISVVLGLSKATRFYSIAGTLVAQRLLTGTLDWQLNDTQSSAQLHVLAGTGIAIRTYYDPYGRVRDGSASPATDHGFLGKSADSGTGLDALGARMYDPGVGRFTSPDPLSDVSTAQTANPYSYAADNPVSFSDPTGLSLCFDKRESCPTSAAASPTQSDPCEIYDCTPAPQSDPCEIYDCTPANKDNSHLPGSIGEGGSPFTDKGCRPTDPFSPCSPTSITQVQVPTLEGPTVIVPFCLNLSHLFFGGCDPGEGGPNDSREDDQAILGPGSTNLAGNATGAGGGTGWSINARMRAAGPGGEFGLPSEGRIRYVPPRGYNPASPLPRGPQGGYIDRFGNEWVVGPSRTKGEPFEWDVQLSRSGQEQLGWLSRDGSHVNVSPNGEVTHK